MKSKFSCLLPLVLLCLTLCACAGQPDGRTPGIGEPSRFGADLSLPGLTMTTAQEDENKVTVTFRNETEETYWYGQSYELEVLREGQWYTLTPAPSEENYGWTAEALAIAPKATTVHTSSLIIYGDHFEAGTYRICKEIYNETEAGMSSIGFLSAEFTLNT